MSENKMTGGTMIRFLRPALLGICLLGLTAPMPTSAGYPDHPIRFINGFTAGGPVDTIARIMAQALSERLGQQFVVENRAGSLSRPPPASRRHPTATLSCSPAPTTR